MQPIAMSPDGTTMLPGDDKLLVRFYLMEILNEARTKADGMNKYDDVEMVEITIPGCRDNCIRKASTYDKSRFKRQYEIFLTTKGEGKEGTPLSYFPFIGPSERRELEYFNIFTGEGLIGLSDIYIEQIPMDVRPLIKKVKNFMEMAKDSAIALKNAEENEVLKSQIELLQDQVKELMSSKDRGENHGNRKDENESHRKHENDSLEGKSSKKRGRPSSGASSSFDVACA
jgi:hypothetical protein